MQNYAKLNTKTPYTAITRLTHPTATPAPVNTTRNTLRTNYTQISPVHPHNQLVLSEVSHYFFPHPDTAFNKGDILLATLTDKHSLYKG